MSHELLALLIAAYCLCWGVIPAALHAYRPRAHITRHHATNGTATTTTKELP